MALYILKRIGLMIPTLIGILLFNFLIIQLVPGGPLDTLKSQLAGDADSYAGFQDSVDTIGGDTDFQGVDAQTAQYLEEFRQKHGLDKPLYQQFFIMVKNYAMFDFGDSMFRNGSVLELIGERIPISIALGLWSSLLIIFISIPLGIAKAMKDGSRFDFWTSTLIIVAYALPSIILPVLLRMYFAGGSEWGIFPLYGLVSENFDELPWYAKIGDYFWHITLPVISMALAGFATKTLLTKNSFLDEIKKQYVTTARAKGLSENSILYGHVFRNAMLIVISGFPAIFISVFFTGSIIVETTFSLDGLGRMGYEAIIQRDYPIVFGTLYIFSLVGLIIQLLADLTYVWVDPRIDFEARNA